MSPSVSMKGRAHGPGVYKDKSKPTDIRTSNINAAKGKVLLVFYLVSLQHILNSYV